MQQHRGSDCGWALVHSPALYPRPFPKLVAKTNAKSKCALPKTLRQVVFEGIKER